MADGAFEMVAVSRRACVLCKRLVLTADLLSRSGRCVDCHTVHLRDSRKARTATVHPSLPFALDPTAQAFVEQHPDGATLEEVGDAIGVTRERIRQLETVALRSLRKRCRLAGITPADLAAVLANRGAGTEHMAPSRHIPSRDLVEAKPSAPAEPGSRPWRHAVSASIETIAALPEELYSPEGVRLAAAVVDLEARAARIGLLLAGQPAPVVVAAVEPQEDPVMSEPRKGTRTITANGKTLTLKGWAEESNLTAECIRMRLTKGWDPTRAVTEPRGAASGKGSTRPPKPKAARPRSETAETLAIIRDVTASLDPVDLLTRLGWKASSGGIAPNGVQLVFIEHR